MKISFSNIFNIMVLIVFCIICAVVSSDGLTQRHLLGYGTSIVIIMISIGINMAYSSQIADNNSTLGVAWTLVNELIIGLSIIINGILLLVVDGIKVFIIVDILFVAIAVLMNVLFIRINNSFNDQDKQMNKGEY